MESNAQLQLALDFVQYTDKNIFLTGKAGTGKTTFLHNLKKVSPKRMAVVAPTGVAAINAGGVTIHSFFQMPFGPNVPSTAELQTKRDSGQAHFKRFNRDKINLIRSLDLLVIDEISMVRADTLDGIDEVLRRYKNPARPFGGIQVLMIGDLHQLSPVVKDGDWQILKHFYPNLYFFSSKALQKSSAVCIELNHIFRQTDAHFINILNCVRENKIDRQLLDTLNQRYIPGFTPADDEGYITLTTHNQTAHEINQVKLASINEKVHRFAATINDEFPEYSYPTVADLELKVGAQVMFVKNDASRDHLFYNGKIGKVLRFNEDTVCVKCPGDTEDIIVPKVEWQNIKYDLNPVTKEVEEKVIGTFTQFPLKLAWAITIHKSQGLTFERAIIDAHAAFAHGQVYVALSRCKSFEGMVLRTPISFNSVKTDGTVADFTKNANGDTPCEEQLKQAKIHFQQSLVYDLFDFTELKTIFFHCRKVVEDNDRIIAPVLLDDLNEIKNTAEKEIYEVAGTFKKQLDQLLALNHLPEENIDLQDRIAKAASYFCDKIERRFLEGLRKTSIETDNKAVKKSITEVLDRLKKEVFIKFSVLNLCKNGFSTLDYIKTKANAGIDFTSSQIIVSKTPKSSIENIPHAGLYNELKKWRNNLASENNTPVYIVLPQKALLGIVTLLPASLTELEAVKGIGKIKIMHYGKELLSMVNDYCERNGIERTSATAGRSETIVLEKEEKVKINTKQVSFDLYKAGRSIPEIAAERGFSVTTIEGHLAHYIAAGELDVYSFVSGEKVTRISDYLQSNNPSSLTEAKTALGDDISYGELKAVMKHLEFLGSEINSF